MPWWQRHGEVKNWAGTHHGHLLQNFPWSNRLYDTLDYSDYTVIIHMAGESHWIIGIPTVWIAVINIVISVLLISPSFGPKVVNAKHPWANKGPFHLLRRHWDPQWSHPQRVVGSIFRKADVCIYIYNILYIYGLTNEIWMSSAVNSVETEIPKPVLPRWLQGQVSGGPLFTTERGATLKKMTVGQTWKTCIP